MSISLHKKILRKSLSLLPRHTLAFNLGKVFTRTLMKPDSKKNMVCFEFGKRFKINADLSEFASNDLYCLDLQFEAKSLKLWEKLAKESEVILDLGSHMGMFSLMANYANPNAKIYPVEICRKNLKILQQNVSKFSNITIIDRAIAPERGAFWFQEDVISGGGFLSTDRNNDEHRVREKSANCYQVEAWPLYDLMIDLDIKKVDLVKMDLEGLEFELLTSQEAFWDHYSPKNLIIEIGYQKAEPQRLDAILSAMSGRGYQYQKLEGLYAFPFKEKEDLANWWFYKA